MYKYLIVLLLFFPSLCACEFIAGVTVPEEYHYVDTLLADAVLKHTGNTATLSLIVAMETEFLVLLAGRNDGINGWKEAVDRLVTSIRELTSQ